MNDPQQIPPMIAGGEMGQQVRDTDWSRTPLGDYRTWPQSLRSSLSLVLNAKGIAALYWGPDQWLLYNDAYGSALGDRHPAAFGRPMPEVLQDIAPVLGPQIAEVLRTGKGFSIENLSMTMRRYGHDEEIVWTYSFSPVQGEDGGFAGVLLLATEMTEQKLAERQRDASDALLHKRESHWRELFEHLQEGFILGELIRGSDGKAVDWTYLDVNSAWGRLVGADPDAARGKTIRQVLRGVEDFWIDKMTEVVDTRSPSTFKRQVGALDRWYEGHAYPLEGDRFAVLFVEITDRVRLEAARAKVQEELQSLNQSLETRIVERTAALLLNQNIIQSHSSPICAFDLDCRLIAFNDAHSDEFFRIYGHRVQLGEVFPDLFMEDQASVVRGFMTRALNGESFTVQEEFGDPALAKPVWEVAYYPLRDLNGRIMGAFHHANDISKRLRAHAELHTTQEALRQAQKMESVGQLTGGLAHDFNNLLAGISGSLELIKRRAALGRYENLERYVGVGLDAAQRAASLTHRLLAFSRRQTLEPKVLGINRLVAEMEELISRTIGLQIDLSVATGDALWPVMADASQLENAMLNLCINARDAMPEGGRLVIETANCSIDDKAANDIGVDPGQYVSLSVSDNGTGMPPHVVERAFDPFFTTKPMGMGTGLGLSMIYGYAKQSGGHVKIRSEVGKGTTVSIYLPRYMGATPASVPSLASALPEVQGNGLTVLLVDDEASVRLFVREILDELGYAVLEAADGIEAQRILQTPARIDLLITDVGLPGGMNGRQVADTARSSRPGLPVLFITGYAENAVLSDGHLDPGMHVMTKPFELDALVARLKRILEAAP